MKCPKCGYNSFEFHDACTKCSHDLTVYKNTFGLKAIVIPQAARSVMANRLNGTLLDNQQPDEADETTEMFSFDLADEGMDSGVVTAETHDDPFNFGNEDSSESSFGEFSFNDEPERDQPAVGADHKNDDFSSLLESTPEDPFAVQDPVPPPPPQKATSPGEFDLDSFSWDEPEPTGTEKPEEDFNNLFGNKDDKK